MTYSPESTEEEPTPPQNFFELDSLPENGDLVSVVTLKPTDGLLVRQSLIDARKLGATGNALSNVPGYGGEVWFVKHLDETEAVYGLDELAPSPDTPEAETNK